MEVLLLKKIVLDINYIVDDILSVIPTKVIYEQSDKTQTEEIHFELNLGGYNIITRVHTEIEYAIKYLQKSLPSNMSIACCQSCRHGNFCPYGDNDNEVFCFKDITPNNKDDVCEVFYKDSVFIKGRGRKLLDFCIEYKPILHDEYYTYNDWGLESL